MACEARTGAGVSLNEPRNWGDGEGVLLDLGIWRGGGGGGYLCGSSPGCPDDIHIFELGPGGGGQAPNVLEALETPRGDS